MTLAWEDVRGRGQIDSDVMDAWRIHYRRIVPSLLAYLSAQGFARPADVIVPLLLEAADRIDRGQAGGRAMRPYVFFVVHRAIARARRTQPNHFATCPSLLRDLTPHERDVLLLRMFAGLSIDHVSLIIRRRRRTVVGLERAAMHNLNELFGTAAGVSDADIATLIAGDGFPRDPGLVHLAAALEQLRTNYLVEVPLHLEDQHIAEITDARVRAPEVSL